LVGHAGHVEVEGTLGHAPERMHLVERPEDVEELALDEAKPVGVLTQTTLSVDDTRDVVEAIRGRFPQAALPRKDDICYATQNRQNAVKDLVGTVDVVLVVGAPESSNSNRLVEIARKAGVAAHLVERADDIRPEWLAGVAAVGVTAGASAPEVLVEEVVERLRRLAPDEAVVESQAAAPEGVVFQLPSELR
ncbi:MAG: 4-hydroxy-3-methylbut-2-enyl diphosphate reductase, partial [Myxococcota bacterium]